MLITFEVLCSLQKLVAAMSLHLYESSGFGCPSLCLSVTLFSSVYLKVLPKTCVSCMKREKLLCPDVLFMTCHLFISFCFYLLSYRLFFARLHVLQRFNLHYMCFKVVFVVTIQNEHYNLEIRKKSL
jgi:hypothetical protein